MMVKPPTHAYIARLPDDDERRICEPDDFGYEEETAKRFADLEREGWIVERLTMADAKASMRKWRWVPSERLLKLCAPGTTPTTTGHTWPPGR